MKPEDAPGQVQAFEGSLSLRRRLVHPPTLLSLAVGIAVIVTIAYRAEVDVGTLARTARAANPLLLLSALLAYYANFPLRGLRWRVMTENARLTGSTPDSVLPSLKTFSEAVFLGWFVNAISFFRMGDPYRAYLVSRGGWISYPAMLGTLVAERGVDLISFAVLAAIVGGFVWAGKPDLTGVVIGAAVALAALALLGLAFLAFAGPRVGSRLPGRLARWYLGFRAGTLSSVRARLPLIAVLSVAGWAAEGARLYLVVLALGLDIPLPAILFVALAHNLITAVPLTPGGLGLAEAGMVGLLSLWTPVPAATAVTVLDRGISYISVLVLGAALFAWRQRRPAKSPQLPTPRLPPWS